MHRRTKWIAGGTIALAAIGGGTGFAVAGTAGDDKPLTGSNLAKAKAAALEHTGGGTVTETELGDGGAAYTVEIRRADGTQVEVQMDKNFRVTGEEPDDDGQGDESGPNDD